MSSSAFYDAGALREIATNLFYGWGYNSYRIENQLRADDQLVRSKAASLLGRAMASVNEAEIEYRRKFLPPPSRQKPFPDAMAIAGPGSGAPGSRDWRAGSLDSATARSRERSYDRTVS